jgi:hypothetical protein
MYGSLIPLLVWCLVGPWVVASLGRADARVVRAYACAYLADSVVITSGFWVLGAGAPGSARVSDSGHDQRNYIYFREIDFIT